MDIKLQYKSKKKISNYSIGNSIGEGTFGKVHLGVHLITNEKVAIKILEKDKIKDEESYERVRREISYLENLKSEFVIQLYEIIENSNSIYLIMEYIENGELFNYIVSKQRLDEKESSLFFVQIINGIEDIHRFNVSHRDLKPENLLISENKILKIIDFGLSNSTKTPDSFLKTPCGSPCYAAPEMLLGKPYNGLEVDIWSTGIILYAMINGFLPFEDDNNSILYQKIIECNLEFPYEVSDRCKDMIVKILKSSPGNRPSIEEIKKHNFYKLGLKYLKKREISFDNEMIEKQTINKMLTLNFNKEQIYKNLNEKCYNNLTATYYILFNSIKREILRNRKSYNPIQDKMGSFSNLINEDRFRLFSEESKGKTNEKSFCLTKEEDEINQLKENFMKYNEDLIREKSSKNENYNNYLKTDFNSNLNLISQTENEQLLTEVVPKEVKKYVNGHRKNKNSFNNVKFKNPKDNVLFKYDFTTILKKQNKKIQIEKPILIKNEMKDQKTSKNLDNYLVNPNNTVSVKTPIEIQQQFFNKFNVSNEVSSSNKIKSQSKVKINQNLNLRNILNDFKSKINKASFTNKSKLNENFSLDRKNDNTKKKTNSNMLKIDSNLKMKDLYLKKMAFSPVNNLSLNKILISNKNISKKIYDKKSVSKEKDKFDNTNNSKVRNNKYSTSVMITDTNSSNNKNIYNNYLTENTVLPKTKDPEMIRKKPKISIDNRNSIDFTNIHTVLKKNFSPIMKPKFEEIKRTNISQKQAINYNKVVSPSKGLEHSYFNIGKKQEIKEMLINFCRKNNLSLNEIGKNKFECSKNTISFVIEVIRNQDSTKKLKITHLTGKEQSTKHEIQKFLSNIEIET